MSGRDEKRPDSTPEDPAENMTEVDQAEIKPDQEFESGDGEEADDFDHYLKKSSKRFHRNSNRSKDRWSDED